MTAPSWLSVVAPRLGVRVYLILILFNRADFYVILHVRFLQEHEYSEADLALERRLMVLGYMVPSFDTKPAWPLPPPIGEEGSSSGKKSKAQRKLDLSPKTKPKKSSAEEEPVRATSDLTQVDTEIKKIKKPRQPAPHVLKRALALIEGDFSMCVPLAKDPALAMPESMISPPSNAPRSPSKSSPENQRASSSPHMDDGKVPLLPSTPDRPVTQAVNPLAISSELNPEFDIDLDDSEIDDMLWCVSAVSLHQRGVIQSLTCTLLCVLWPSTR